MQAFSEDLMEAPIRTIIQELRGGPSAIQAMVILETKIDDEYAKHTLAILDAVLVHLRNSPSLNKVQHTTMALAAFRTLSVIFQWHHHHPATSPPSTAAVTRIHGFVDNFVYWLTSLLEHLPEELNQPQALRGYDTMGRFICTLFLAFPDIEKALAQSPAIVKIGIFFCYRLHYGSPIVYPGDRPSDPLCDEPDPGSAILFSLAKYNPVGLADMVSSEVVCSRQTFVRRIVRRMKCFISLGSISRLSYHSQVTSEKLNVHYIVGATDRLMDYAPSLRDLFVEERAPEVYTEAIAIQMRLAARLLDADKRARILVDLFVAPLRWWDLARATDIIPRAGALVDAGLFSAVGNLLPIAHIGDKYDVVDKESGFRLSTCTFAISSALRAIMPYILHPRVLAKSCREMEANVNPSMKEVPSDSPYKEYFPSTLLYLQNCERTLSREHQEMMCDNLNHWSTTSVKAGNEALHTEKICSRCHTVAYCSRECQKEDWKMFHRRECALMWLEYYKRKSAKRWYPYSTRRFHASILRYALESMEVGKAIVGPELGANLMWTQQYPRNVIDFIDPLKVMDDMTLCWGKGLNTWIGSISPILPEHLRPRFDAFLRSFTPSLHIPEYTPGSVRLLEKAFRFGDEDVRLVVLLCQGYAMPTVQGTKDQRMDMAKRFSLRDPMAKSHYQFLGSFAFYGIAEEYCFSGPEMLNAIFKQLGKPLENEDEDDGDEEEEEDKDRVEECADIFVESVALFVEVVIWLCEQEKRDYVSVSTSLRLFSDAEDYITGILYHLTSTVTPTKRLRAHSLVGQLFLLLPQANPRLLSQFSRLPCMLDLAIALWIARDRGCPVLYPQGLPSKTALVAEAGDYALDLFQKLTQDNPRGMANAILDGRICEPQLFVKHAVRRMTSLMSVHQLPHLTNVRRPTVELGNAQHIVYSMKSLMEEEDSLRVMLMRTSRYTERFMQALATMAKRLSERELKKDAEQVEQRVRYMLEVVELTECVVGWVAKTSTNIVRNMRRVMDAGGIFIFGQCVPFVSDQRYHRVDTIFRTMVPYALYRRTMGLFVAAVSDLASPRLLKTPNSSFRKGSTGSVVMSLVPLRELLEGGSQRNLCDNIQHKSSPRRHVVPADGEKICGACRSVSYCSKECQAADWNKHHRLECSALSDNYWSNKQSGSLYHYRYRKLHSSILCYAFESYELNSRSLRPHFMLPGQKPYSPAEVHNAIQIVFEDTDVDCTMEGVQLDHYVKKTLPLIPDCKKARFNTLVSTFRSWVVQSRRRTSNAAKAENGCVIGSLRLVERVFRFGDIDVFIVLLLEQTRPFPAATGTINEKNTKLSAFAQRKPNTESPFEILGSLHYTT
ncbi:hypothetical protein NMY22_g7940 [Coprinellus aureogranulatus]|nr:hypothetical protein NMY22_g7940 [Coprinellus aureogranulatus]